VALYGEPVEGTPFGRYRLITLLGRGGMGEVWRAYDTETKRTVAIKVLPPHLADDSDFVRRFRREAEAAAQLNSPHVVPIHTYGEIDGRLYVDMRLVEGRDLHTVLTEGPLPPTRAVRIIEGVALALHAAHEAGLLHRDVKPSNILLDRNDFAYLIDFGIARTLDDTRITKTGSAIGTYHYIAPERLTIGTDEDARVDIYSLACVLYECLTGSPPFPAGTMPQLIGAHLYAPPPQPSTTQPDVPPAVDHVIATGMAKDPDQRYATTIELATAARDAITEPIQRPTPAPATLPATEQAPLPATERAGNHLNAQPSTLMAGSPAPTRPAPPPQPVAPSPPRPPWWRRPAIVIPAALWTVAVIAIVLTVTNQRRENSNSSAAQREPTYGPQVTLPFTGLKNPQSLAVDAAGSVYVHDYGRFDDGSDRVVGLAAGTSTPTVLPFTDFIYPAGLAVDTAGSVYAVGSATIGASNQRVVKLAAGSSTQTTLPLGGLVGAEHPAVDGAGNVYVTGSTSIHDLDQRVLVKLAAGSSTQTELPLTGLSTGGVAVDAAGNVYVTGVRNAGTKDAPQWVDVRVVKLAAGSSTQTVLPFTGLSLAVGVAVDGTGNVYVTDIRKAGTTEAPQWVDARVVKLAAGSSTQTVLPFTDLKLPVGVAVDGAGSVYVADKGNNRVVKLPVQ
jgi:serine/threonine protein kinase, bacterial